VAATKSQRTERSSLKEAATSNISLAPNTVVMGDSGWTMIAILIVLMSDMPIKVVYNVTIQHQSISIKMGLQIGELDKFVTLSWKAESQKVFVSGRAWKVAVQKSLIWTPVFKWKIVIKVWR
jgi:hypothetical protein